MRKINKTIYAIIKMDAPSDGINVSQIITDDLVEKSKVGEAEAAEGATELLDQKADELNQQSDLCSNPLPPGGSKMVKASGGRVPKAAEAKVKTANVEVARQAQTPRKKLAKKVVSKKKIKAQKAKESNTMMYLIIIILLGVGAYAYTELM